jgi:hypothetical protein
MYPVKDNSRINVLTVGYRLTNTRYLKIGLRMQIIHYTVLQTSMVWMEDKVNGDRSC